VGRKERRKEEVNQIRVIPAIWTRHIQKMGNY
jgi:hypothetical protein